MTLDAGRNTVVAATQGRGGRVLRSAFLRGRFTIPAVALDGSAGGLSADGRTLVLISPRPGFPRAATPLAVFDARTLRKRATVRLRADFSYDAISADGRRLFLIEYTSRRDPTRYAVREFDLRRERLLPDPIVDPDEKAGEMRGFPVTRATSPDGRWVYTLYDGAGKEPFVHALDTQRPRAVCIDLDGVEVRDVYGLRFGQEPDGSQLSVAAGKRTLALIDTRTLTVARPGSDADGSGGGIPDALLLIFAVLAGGSLIAYLRRRRPRALASDGGPSVKGS